MFVPFPPGFIISISTIEFNDQFTLVENCYSAALLFSTVQVSSEVTWYCKSRAEKRPWQTCCCFAPFIEPHWAPGGALQNIDHIDLLPLKKARSSIRAPVVSSWTRPLLNPPRHFVLPLPHHQSRYPSLPMDVTSPEDIGNFVPVGSSKPCTFGGPLEQPGQLKSHCNDDNDRTCSKRSRTPPCKEQKNAHWWTRVKRTWRGRERTHLCSKHIKPSFASQFPASLHVPQGFSVEVGNSPQKRGLSTPCRRTRAFKCHLKKLVFSLEESKCLQTLPRHWPIATCISSWVIFLCDNKVDSVCCDENFENKILFLCFLFVFWGFFSSSPSLGEANNLRLSNFIFRKIIHFFFTPNIFFPLSHFLAFLGVHVILSTFHILVEITPSWWNN